MTLYPLAEEVLAPVLRVAMTRALGSPGFLGRHIPPRKR